jgi:hypothetical protein
VDNLPRATKTKTNLETFLKKYFYFFMSLLIAAVVVYGFSQTVEKKLFHAAPPRPLILYVHGAVFFGWLLFFTLQSALVRTHRIQWHQQVGWLGAVLGMVVFVVGVATAITMARFNRIILHSRYPEANLLISFFDIAAFTIPFALAIYWREKPELHRRLQFLACCALTAAAFGRFLPSLLLPATRHSLTVLVFNGWVTLYAGVDALVLIAVARDWIVNRRVHPVYLYGLSAFIACQTLVLYTVVHRSVWWMKTAQDILG